VRVYGHSAGINITADKIEYENNLKERGYYIIKTSTKYLQKVYNGVRKLINLSPQRKYEILETCFADNQE
jgi:hypothetical protein